MDTYVRKTPILCLHAWQQLIFFAEYFTSTINVEEICIYHAFRMFLQVYSRWEIVLSDLRRKESCIYRIELKCQEIQRHGNAGQVETPMATVVLL